jgi:hypothetical protein
MLRILDDEAARRFGERDDVVAFAEELERLREGVANHRIAGDPIGVLVRRFRDRNQRSVQIALRERRCAPVQIVVVVARRARSNSVSSRRAGSASRGSVARHAPPGYCLADTLAETRLCDRAGATDGRPSPVADCASSCRCISPLPLKARPSRSTRFETAAFSAPRRPSHADSVRCKRRAGLPWWSGLERAAEPASPSPARFEGTRPANREGRQGCTVMYGAYAHRFRAGADTRSRK